MRLGLSSYTYTWAVGVPGREQPVAPMRAEDLIDRAVALDVPVVQIADNLPFDSGTRNLDRLTEHARACGVDIEVGIRGIGQDHLRRYLAVAVAVGSPLLRVVVDTADHHPTPAEVVDRLAVLRPEFEAAGVVLAIENHDRFTAKELAGVVTALGTEWTGVCLDTVNSFGALEGPAVVVGTLAGLAVNLHVKDFAVVRAPHSMGFTIEGRPAGGGRLDVPGLLAAIGRHRNDITAVLELWTPPQETLDATLTTERRWAEESVAYLKTLIPSFDPQPIE